MSRAEELLDSLTEEQIVTYGINPSAEPHIVIESDKTISVPDELKHIAVQGEHNIETVTFDCPRYWDGHDLSQMQMRIVYQRPDGHREPHIVENLRVDEADENTIHFDWTVSGNVTAVKGNISFMVCAKLSDSEGNREREWHTRLNQDLIVDEGMDCSGDEIVEQNSDILEAILVQLDDLKNTGGVSDEQIANAVAAYLTENPIESGVDEQQVRDIVAVYLEENPPEGGTITEEQIATAVANYMSQHPVEGEDGGHYIPVVTQPTDNTMQVSFTPSKTDMPAVDPVTVNLPVSEGSGQNAELDVTLTQSGKAADAKATGDKLAELKAKIPEGGGTDDYSELSNKPSINGVTLDGNKTAEELGIGKPTDEQVANSVQEYLDAHPEATTTVADGSITAAKLAEDLKGELYENTYLDLDMRSRFDGYALDGTGGYVEDANSEIRVYAVTEGSSYRLKLAADNAGVYQWQWVCDTLSHMAPFYCKGETITEAVDGAVESPAGAVRLVVSQLKTNTTNLVQSLTVESVVQNNRELIEEVKISGLPVRNIAVEQLLERFNDNIREIDLNSPMLIGANTYNNGYRTYDPVAKKGYINNSRDYATVGLRVFYLEEGDRVITNIDSLAEKPNTTQRGVIMSSFTNNNETVDDERTIAFADGKFSGAFRTIEIQVSGKYCFSYRKSAANKMYIFHDKAPLFQSAAEYQDVTSEVTVTDGTVTYNSVNGFGETIKDNNGNMGLSGMKATNMLTFEDMEGYSLLVDGYHMDQRADNGIAVVYYTDPDDPESKVSKNLVFRKYMQHDVITVPLRAEKVHFRVLFEWTANAPFVRFRIVPNEFLFERGLANPLFYGKRILAFGDSYVAGQGITPTWYSLLASRNYGTCTSHGYGGAGLCSNYGNTPLLNSLSDLDEDADIYFLTCGRNDSSGDIPIGNNADMWDGVSNPWTCSFKGGLNYMYKYIMDRHPDALIVAVTPWAFVPGSGVTTGLDCIDYIEAIKLISEKWGIYCLNAAQRCGIYVRSEAFRAQYFKEAADYSHLNHAGHELMCDRAAEVMSKELYA